MHPMSILLRPLCGAMLLISAAASGADVLPPASTLEAASAMVPLPEATAVVVSGPAPAPAPAVAAAPAPNSVPASAPAMVRAPAAANAATLEQARGGAEVISNEARLSGAVSNNSATQVTTGANIIQSNSFANASGIPVVIQNSGANVLIQNATVINLQLK